MDDLRPGPAFYALSGGGWRDYWTLLHPPYTMWHLSYVAIGACLAPVLDPGRLGLALLGFFLAIGVGAHALDELHGRPLGTGIPSSALVTLAIAGLGGAVGLGIYGSSVVSWWGLVFIAVGSFFVPAYNLEWLGGLFHTDAVFALMWGGFPVIAAYFAQTGRIGAAAIFAAAACTLLSGAQRRLSTPVRRLRREVSSVAGAMVLTDGSRQDLDADSLREAPEGALRVMWIGLVLLAIGLVIARWP